MVKSFLSVFTFCVFFLSIVSAQQPVSPVAAPTTVPEVSATAAPEVPVPIDPPAASNLAPQISPVIPVATAPEVSGSAVDASISGSGAMSIASSISSVNVSGRAVNEFQGDDVAQVLRLLARQAKINVVVSDKVDASQMKITMRLEDKTPLEAIKVIASAKGLMVDENEGVYFIKTKEEKEAEPTESAFYTLSYASAEKVIPLLKEQLVSKSSPQFDQRTNTIFYREAKSNLKAIRFFLDTVDKPTRQVMIEARLVEVNASPTQSYGFNWGGVVGSAASPQVFKYGGSTASAPTTSTNPITGAVQVIPGTNNVPLANGAASLNTFNFSANPNTALQGLAPFAGQLAILSAPQMSVTMRMLNEDADAEFLANPRIVTANNMVASIKIVRNQPVPMLNFNAQTATAEFSGFQDKTYGSTLQVLPIINKDSFISMNVKPEISNKIGDQTFNYQGTNVSSPIIDMRTLESNVLIKSGDTLAIGGLLQDQTTKGSNKVPVAGDIPVLGYLFQEHLNARTKRNLLVFVTPTIIRQGYGTGLEDQAMGLHDPSTEDFADPNGWRNNAKGSIRAIPTSHAPLPSHYPPPGYPRPGTPLNQVYKSDDVTRDQ